MQFGHIDSGVLDLNHITNEPFLLLVDDKLRQTTSFNAPHEAFQTYCGTRTFEMYQEQIQCQKSYRGARTNNMTG